MSEFGDSQRLPSELSERDQAAAERDLTSDAHDEVADARDVHSEARDARADARDQARQSTVAHAASDRAGAKRDRQDSAGNRHHSGDDRTAASSDRIHSARERAAMLLDELTGAYRRDPALLELEREVVKAHRTGAPFVLAFLDVDGLKRLNDSEGHRAGDQLLAGVATAVRGEIREYDVVVRYGGDEFLCGMLDLDLVEAERRFETAKTSLAASSQAGFTVGLVSLAPEERLDDLIVRADAEMYARRRTGSGN